MATQLLNPKGQTVNIPVTSKMELQFGFEVGSGLYSHEGDNLVITFDDGGKIVLEGFYAQPKEELPSFIVEEGVDIPAEQFLAQFNDESLLPAAGPAARAPGSGGTGEYLDDAGNLIDGVNRLGGLGNTQWGRGTEVSVNYLDSSPASGTFDVYVSTGLKADAGMYEDDQARQNIGDYTVEYPKINFIFTPVGNTQVEGVNLSGFSAGTKIYLGVPGAPGTTEITISSEGQIVPFSHAQLNAGVYLIPPNNSDADMNINISVDLRNNSSGITNTITGNAIFVVDAVADLPDLSLGEMSSETQDNSSEDISELKLLTFPVTASFNDVDSSEYHYIILEGIPAGWDIHQLPAGWSVRGVGDAEYPIAYAGSGLVIQIPNNVISVSGDIVFDPKDWSNERDVNGNPHPDERYANGAIITVKDAAWEHDPKDAELSDKNNYAERQGETIYQISIPEDKPDFDQDTVRILSDETAGRQTGQEITHLDSDVLGVLSSLGLSGSSFVSAATSNVSYTLKSDGTNDSGGNAGQSKITFEIADGTDSGLKTSSGQAIFLYQSEDGHMLGRVGGESGSVAFVVTITEAGLNSGENTAQITFVQYMALEHPTGGDSHNEKLADALKLTLAVYDDEGDRAETSVSINVRDDGPKMLCDNHWVNLSETDLAGGSDQHHLINNVHGNLHDESLFIGFIGFSFGADGPASTTNAAGTNPFVWDTIEGYKTYDADGKPVDVTWQVSEDGLTLTGFAEGGSANNPAIIIKANLTPHGATYSVDQVAPLFHEQPNNNETLKLEIGFTITDGDGDTTTGDLTISIKDDVPYAGKCDINDIVYEKDLRDGGVIVTSGELSAFFGADGANAETPITWDKGAITNELGNYKVIIDGEPISITQDMISFSDNGKTFTVSIDNKPVISATLSYDPTSGKCSYSYTQHEPLEHGEPGTLADLEHKLDLKYIIMDGDGDTSSNELDIYVADSVALPSGSSGHFDETDARSGFPLIGVIDLKLDYDAPDGIKDVNWNKTLIDKALDVYNDAAPAEADGFSCSVSNDGSVLTISQFGKAVLELTLERNPDGTYSAHYKQLAPMDHPLGAQVLGLSHDEPIPFMLPVNVVDGDGDTTLSLVNVKVDDDGPNPVLTSNVALLETIGNVLLNSLDDLDISNADAFVASLTKALGDSLTVGVADIGGLLDLADLVLDKDLSRFNSPEMQELLQDLIAGEVPNLNSLNINTLNTLVKGVPGYEPFNGNFLHDAPIYAKLIADFAKGPERIVEILLGGSDADRTEGNAPYIGEIKNIDFGADGPAENNPVTWSKLGVQGILQVLGVHAAGSDNPLIAEGSGTVLNIYDGQGGALVMTLTLTESGNKYGYEITQHLGLEHTQGMLGDLLSQLGGNLLTSAIPAELQSLMDTLNIDAETLLGLLDGGKFLTLPLPIVVTDHDGDIAPGLISLTIRDSLPIMGTITQPEMVYESDLTLGTDSLHTDPALDDQSKTEGSFSFKAGFDGLDNIALNGTNINLGAIIEGTYGKLKITAISIPDANGNVEVEYEYQIEKSATHKDGEGANTELVSGDEKFTITITDKDGDIAEGAFIITIKDDVPQAIAETDSLDAPSVEAGLWTASGNILSGDSTSSEGNTDKFGADERRAGDGLKVEGKDWSSGVNPDGEITINGKYGDLYMKTDGSYRYVVDPNKEAWQDEAPLRDVFEAQITTLPISNTVNLLAPLTINLPEASQYLHLEFPKLDKPILGAEQAKITVTFTDGTSQTFTVVGANNTLEVFDKTFSTAVSSVKVEAGTLTSSFTVNEVKYTAMVKVGEEPDPNWTPKEEFEYSITDKDGDSADAKLIIDIKTTPSIIGGQGEDLNVDEAYIQGGTLHGETTSPDPLNATGTVTFSTPEGVGSVAIAGTNVSFDNVGNWTGSIATPYGFITNATLTSLGGGQYTLNYTYKLNDNAMSTTAGDERNIQDNADSFNIVIRDKFGSTDADKISIDVKVDIKDDIAIASVDTGSLSEANATLSVNALNGVLSNDQIGADAQAGFTVQGVSANDATNVERTGSVGAEVTGDYGNLTLQADGSYSYTLTSNIAPNVTVNDVFTYTIKDADGDWKTTTLTISTKGTNETPIITPNVGSLSVTLHDDGLTGGTQSDTAPHTTSGTGLFEIDSKTEGLSALTIAGKTIDLSSGVQSVLISAPTDVYAVTVTGVSVDA
ncbi:DUF5801 repeats-in-toxin domain-containing protein, partial [Desulfovibrio litoralis]